MSNVRTQAISVDPVIDTALYTANDVVGDLQDIPLGSPKGAAVLKDVKVIDIDNQKAPLTILFFRAAPTGIAANNAAAALSAADAKLLIAKVNVLATDYETVGVRAVANVEVSKVLKGGGLDATKLTESRHVWMSIVTTGAPTYTTTASLRVILGLLNDL